MAIIQNTMEDIKRYICSNERIDEATKEKTLQILPLFMCPQVAENTGMQAVVGFEAGNVPQFWDMTEGNLLVTCKTGVAMNYMGCTTVLISMLLRFAKEAFQYYLFIDDIAPNYLRNDKHCAGNASALFDMREVYYSTLKKFFNELNYRKALSEAELQKQPFLLIVFGNAYRCFDDNEFESFRELFSLLFRQGKRLRVACMMMAQLVLREFLYYQYQDTFSCFVVGPTYLETAKELLKENIPDWLLDRHEMYACLFQNKDSRVQIQTYNLQFWLGLV